MFRRYILPWLVFIVYRLWSWSWRKSFVEHDEFKRLKESGQPFIFAHWHGDELPLILLIGPYKVATMTSQSQDGELMNFVVRRVGGQTTRGSSSKGAIGALKGLIRLLKKGRAASMAVDGPRGPYHQVKPGVFELSRLAGASIVPLGVAARPNIVFEKSWNKAILPRPFAKVVIYLGEPLVPLLKSDDPKDLSRRDNLTRELYGAKQQASQIIATNSPQ